MKKQDTKNIRAKTVKRQQRGGILLIGKNYYLKFTLNGKQIKRVLKDEMGEPVRDKEKAIELKEKILAQYSTRDKQALTEQMLMAIKSDDEKIKVAAKKADEILNPALTFEKAWPAYVINQERPQDSSERCFHHYKGYFNKFSLWMKANKPRITQLRGVTKEIVAEYAIHLKRQCIFSAGTFNKHITLLKTMFYHLSGPAKLELNPFESIKKMKSRPNSRRELTIEEIQLILETAEDDLQLLFGIGIFTGLRLGDCCTLLWEETNLSTRSIKRIPNKTAKSQKSVIVGIPDVLYNKLIETPKTKRTGFVLPFYADKYETSHTFITRLIQKHFKACDIKIYKTGTGPGTKKRAVLEVGFHSLRHSYISINAKAGVSQNVLVKLAGHSEKMSELYTHINAKDARQLADNYSKMLTSNVIDVESIDDRIANVLNYLKTADISEAIKIELINILNGV